jgi:hypothetical protein
MAMATSYAYADDIQACQILLISGRLLLEQKHCSSYAVQALHALRVAIAA